MTEHFDLQRFRDAQDAGGTYDRALAELRAGHKQSHWMWFVFPQLAGLGSSAMAQRYAIRCLAEATAYADDPVLGARLRECAGALLGVEHGSDPVAILGPIDALKLRSSMTLFAAAMPAEPSFTAVLARHYSGSHDEATLALLAPGKVFDG